MELLTEPINVCSYFFVPGGNRTKGKQGIERREKEKGTSNVKVRESEKRSEERREKGEEKRNITGRGPDVGALPTEPVGRNKRKNRSER